ncbi:MAG TPA: DUF1697 domain-containing protein [Chloroflexota bacterium]|nr:DUF1697 domain-containing protein [Chloroflexota bacterium]
MDGNNTTYIALLRGVNVGGHRVTMERLRSLFGDLGFTRVRSYIQTGNVFFESDDHDTAALRTLIERQLQGALGYEVPTCLRTVRELEQLLAADPFNGIPVTSDTRLSVTFLAEPARVPLTVPYQTPDEAYEVIGMTPSELFVVWHLRDGRPSNSYGLLERQCPVPTTTRFWHTTAKILAAAKET